MEDNDRFLVELQFIVFSLSSVKDISQPIASVSLGSTESQGALGEHPQIYNVDVFETLEVSVTYDSILRSFWYS